VTVHNNITVTGNSGAITVNASMPVAAARVASKLSSNPPSLAPAGYEEPEAYEPRECVKPARLAARQVVSERCKRLSSTDRVNLTHLG